MIFYLSTSRNIPISKQNIVILYTDNWDDWFTYSTLYNVYYYFDNGDDIHLGSIKIGQKGMKDGQRRPDLPDHFENLESIFFSLGQDVSYYENINKLGDDNRHELLRGLNDIAYDSRIYKLAIKEDVTKTSLLRSVSIVSVEGQFRRLAQGNAALTPYNFRYNASKHAMGQGSRMMLDFNIIPNSNPPTNIHVVIGRNGVGKTHLFNNMISTLLTGNRVVSKNGYFSNIDSNESDDFFANLISVSFSAFDETYPIEERKDKTKHLKYSYIGLKEIENDYSSNTELTKRQTRGTSKSPDVLKEEFVKSVEMCRKMAKNARWLNALEILESDQIFKESEVTQIAKIPIGESFKKIASSIFGRLSSGHKIVLLTITRLIETIEERSLVLLDEPEGYLHPPLLSAFIRALSDLLINRNAVAIIGTHSPVVLQEVPKSCVWKLRRHGATAIAERLDIESFGENVGLLTQEVFGLEVTESGFHKLLQNLAEETNSYQEAISMLDNQLGFEGKSILRNLQYNS